MAKSGLFTRSMLGAAFSLMAGAAVAQGGVPPHPMAGGVPNAQPGECYARVAIPARFENVSEEVIVADAREAIQVTQARFATEQESILVKEAGVRYEVRQPRYETRTEEVLVRPGYEQLVVEPAQFRTVTEAVQISAPRLVWKPGKNIPGARATHTDPTTGVVYCLVEVPGDVAHVQKTVVVKPETVRRVAVAPQTMTVTKQVLVDPGGVREIPIPAQYRDINVQRLVEPGQTFSRPVPPRTQTVNKRVQVSEERFEWVKVSCDGGQTVLPEAQGLMSSPRWQGQSSMSYGVHSGGSHSMGHSTGYSSSHSSHGESYSSGSSYTLGSSQGYTTSYPSTGYSTGSTTTYHHSGSGSAYSTGTVYGGQGYGETTSHSSSGSYSYQRPCYKGECEVAPMPESYGSTGYSHGQGMASSGSDLGVAGRTLMPASTASNRKTLDWAGKQ